MDTSHHHNHVGSPSYCPYPNWMDTTPYPSPYHHSTGYDMSPMLDRVDTPPYCDSAPSTSGTFTPSGTHAAAHAAASAAGGDMSIDTVFAEGPPSVFSDHPHTPPLMPSCNSPAAAAVIVTSAVAEQHQHQQTSWCEPTLPLPPSCAYSSSSSSMPPTPPDPTAMPGFFAPGLMPPPLPSVYPCMPPPTTTTLLLGRAPPPPPPSATVTAPTRASSSLIIKRKSKRADKPKDKKKCANCGATKTPTWRRGPVTRWLLCNACGLYEKVSRKRRVVTIQPDGKTKISRGALNGQQQEDQKQQCSRCAVHTAKRWHERTLFNVVAAADENTLDNNSSSNSNKKQQQRAGRQSKEILCDRCARSTTAMVSLPISMSAASSN
ncbi:hypothetical protein BDB00DRAFT_935222 [Zychaea mexicana]|uniref:uncharacterized protein n=1 Tax=Zychaea mexicana TaxID=64656 RepID=UPI0022FF113E|nr:uncharacterized protein BDB00DRAFT_935222 [Zychaea mexicana]KAI9498972.1 hypothetical protein BDB00DRAFT_935222 [Zychaea mexicana]